MLKTIPTPTNPTALLVYDGLVEWFPVLCDSATGEILDDSTIPLFSNTWSWAKLEALTQDATDGKCSIIALGLSCPAFVDNFLPPITIKDVLSAFFSEVVSGACVSDEQRELWWQTLVAGVSRTYNVTVAEAPKLDLRSGSDYQVKQLGGVFSTATGTGYDIARVVGTCAEPAVVRVKDLLKAVLKELET